MQGSFRPSGALKLRKIPLIPRPSVGSINDAIRYGTQAWAKGFGSELGAWQRRNARNFERSLTDQAAFDGGRLRFIGHLWLAKHGLDGSVHDYGLVSCRVVTDAGVQFIVDAFQNLVELENMRYHGLGTGTTAEAATQTALVTELTTQYSTSNTRPTGTLGEKSGDAKTYETTATITVTASVAATEHGILSQAATGGGTMLDRSVFAAVNLASGESLQATYQLTFASGG